MKTDRARTIVQSMTEAQIGNSMDAWWRASGEGPLRVEAWSFLRERAPKYSRLHHTTARPVVIGRTKNRARI